MKTFILSLLTLMTFLGCSTTQPKNRWQYQATSSLNAYTQHYLEGNELRAKTDLARARHEASKSARLHTLIDIELSACAMHISVLEADSCEKASELLALEPEPSQLAYLNLLNKKLSPVQIQDLPQQYRDFASALLNKDTLAFNNDVKNMQPLSSRLLASALIKEHLSEENLRGLIEELSYHGYKRALLAWLKLQIEKEDDPKRKENLMSKLKVLISY